MLWVYDHYKYSNPFSAGTVFTRQNLTPVDIRRIKTVPALKGADGGEEVVHIEYVTVMSLKNINRLIPGSGHVC